MRLSIKIFLAYSGQHSTQRMVQVQPKLLYSCALPGLLAKIRLGLNRQTLSRTVSAEEKKFNSTANRLALHYRMVSNLATHTK